MTDVNELQTKLMNLHLQSESQKEAIEILRNQLAACGVVALANTDQSAEAARKMHPSYMSDSCKEVIKAVDREIALRSERDSLAAALQPFTTHSSSEETISITVRTADIGHARKLLSQAV